MGTKTTLRPRVIKVFAGTIARDQIKAFTTQKCEIHACKYTQADASGTSEEAEDKLLCAVCDWLMPLFVNIFQGL